MRAKPPTVRLALENRRGRLWVAFWGTCVSLVRAKTEGDASQKVAQHLIPGWPVRLRPATEADLEQWVRGGGRQERIP